MKTTKNKELAKGDYVLATKYKDGDPLDHWCVGFYAGLTKEEKYGTERHDVVDNSGKQFRGNGFRRVQKITAEQGEHVLKLGHEYRGESIWDLI